MARRLSRGQSKWLWLLPLVRHPMKDFNHVSSDRSTDSCIIMPLQGTYNAAYIPRTQMSNCIRPGVSTIVSTAATATLAGALSCTIEETFALPFVRFSRASTSLRIDCDGVRWSGVVCFCRPIAVYSVSKDSRERPNKVPEFGGMSASSSI